MERESINVDFKAIFSPYKIGTLELKNRLICAPMGLCFASGKDSLSDFLARRARGGVGLVIMGAPRRSILPGWASQKDIDKAVAEMMEVKRMVHAEGVPVGMQIHHHGRQSYNSETPIAPSPIPCPVNRLMPRELTTDEVVELVEAFAEGVMRAKSLGFDLAEIHAAHGYLISQFLSLRSNERTDSYGGDVYRRARFLVDILRSSREKVGNSYPITVRLNSSDNIDRGMTPEEFEIIANLIDEAGADLISVSGGVNGSYPLTAAPFYSPQALYAEAAAKIKRFIRIPVAVGGRVPDIATAEQIVRQGKADFVILGRALIADPDLPLKAERGDVNRIRPCIYCNQGCMKHLEGAEEATCTVNPQLGFESKLVIKTNHIKKVLVIGGGISGIEAAWVAANRGHQVTLCEERNELGGQWLLAAKPPHKERWALLLKWLKLQAINEKVLIKTGVLVTTDLVKLERPDAVIVATGAIPIKPPITGAEKAVSAWDVLRGNKKVGEKVVVIGGSAVGLETAHLLSVQDKNVTVIEMKSKIGIEMAPTVRWHLRRLLNDHHVRILTSTRLTEISDNGLIIETLDGMRTLTGEIDIIFAVGCKPKNDLEKSLKGVVNELYVIGDAAAPRNALTAIRDGWEIGCTV